MTLMSIIFIVGGFTLLTHTFGTLWWEERHLTTRDLFKDIGGRR